MRGIILAAGRGSRLGSLTADRPKCLVEVRGRALLDWQISSMREAGIEEICVVRGYLAESIVRPRLTTFENPRWSMTNMVSSLACAAAWLREDDCVVSYADIFYGAGHVQALLACPEDIAMTFDVDWLALWSRRFADPLSDAETFATDGAGLVRDIGRKPHSLDEIHGQYMGLLKFSPTGWQIVESYLASLPLADVERMSMTELLQRLIGRGVRVGAVPVRGDWGEVDSADDLAFYEAG